MVTYSYKDGFIHDNFTTDKVQAQVGHDVYSVKSVRAAKILITKLMKNK